EPGESQLPFRREPRCWEEWRQALKRAGFFPGQIATDQLRPQLMRRYIENRDAVAEQALVQLAAGAKVVPSAEVGQGIIEAADFPLAQSIENPFAQTDHQHPGLPRQALHSFLQFTVVVAQV